MEAETLKCPMCGAPAASDATACSHCGARLATVACPSCFGLIFEGAKFCPHCGAKVERTETAAADPRLCPRCRQKMEAVTVGKARLLECGKCEGVWIDAATLQEICADREEQSAVLGMATSLPDTADGALETVRYLPCPVCQDMMNRVNFGNCSHVIADVCGKHGTWFDRDELRKVIEFIRAGGLEKSRARQIADLEHQRSLLKMDQIKGAGGSGFSSSSMGYHDYEWAFGLVGEAVKFLLK